MTTTSPPVVVVLIAAFDDASVGVHRWNENNPLAWRIGCARTMEQAIDAQQAVRSMVEVEEVPALNPMLLLRALGAFVRTTVVSKTQHVSIAAGRLDRQNLPMHPASPPASH